MPNWLFQANPDRYDVARDFAEGVGVDAWSITRHREDVAVGDRAALWLAGSNGGVVAIGEVTGEPYEDVADARWARAEDVGRTFTFCPLRFDDVFIGAPIERAALAADPVFQRARILTQPQAGSPFMTTDDEWSVVERMRGGGGIPERGRRNPTWSTDELILALDLYLRRGLLDDADQDVIDLSELLNRLPIHTFRPDQERFRNPNGVALKLANFAALDPGYDGVGMSRGGLGDRTVWDRYSSQASEVRALADAIRGGIAGQHAFPVVPEEDEQEAEEGRLLFRRHRARERNPSLSRRKKERAKAQHGRLACEACGFDFEAAYGELGRDFIECHHVVPLSESGVTTTRLTDLALLCANCHRMAHRRRPWPTVEDLRGHLII